MSRRQIIPRGLIGKALTIDRLYYCKPRLPTTREDWDDKDAAKHLLEWGKSRVRRRTVLLEELSSLGKSAGQRSYSTAVYLAALQGDVATAREIVDIMKRRQIELTMGTYTNLMLASTVNGNLKEVAEVWVHVEENTDHTHDIRSYTLAMNAAASAGKGSVVFEIFEELQSKGLEPTSLTYKPLISVSSSRSELLSFLKTIPDDVIDIIILEQLVSTFSDMSCPTDVHNTMQATLTRGIKPTTKMWHLYLRTLVGDQPSLVSVVNSNEDIPMVVLKRIYHEIELLSAELADSFLSKLSDTSLKDTLSKCASWRVPQKVVATRTPPTPKPKPDQRPSPVRRKLPAIPHLI